MTAKTKNLVKKLYCEHLRASARCDAWAEKAIRYRQSGEWRKAERAESRTFECLTRMKRLADLWDGLSGLASPATMH
jgi:hypothetical protein